MATWDGSYSEDQNYYVYSDQNVPVRAPENWTFFSENVNNGYLPTNRECYMQNEPVFEQHCENTFYHIDTDISSNLLPLSNNYDGQFVGNTINGTPVESGNLEYYPNTAKSPQCFTSAQYWNSNYGRKSRMADNHFASNTTPDIQPQIAGPSTLHATANEFVPNNAIFKDEKARPEGNRSFGNQEPYVRSSRSKVESDGRASFDRFKREKKYEKKRNTNIKNREGQQAQFEKGNICKRTYKQQGRNYNKFQRDKYFNNEFCLDKSQEAAVDIDTKQLFTDAASNSDVHVGRESSISMVNTKEDKLSVNVYTSRSENSANVSNQEGSARYRDNTSHINRGKRQTNRSKEFSYANFSSRQSQWSNRNTTKYSYDKYDRDENNYKDTRHSYQGHNGIRENHNKDDRVETKEKSYGYQDHNGFREYYNKESKTEGKERRYNYQAHNGFREYHNKENKNEAFREKDKSRNVVEYRHKENENWRNKKESSERSNGQKRGQNKKSLIDDDASQRERLTEQLNKGQLECLVCCEYIKQTDYIWSCSNCYHVLHLKCIRKWAKSSQGDNGWRCPACQNVNLTVPKDYFCFCGKTRAPEWNARDVAHSCGEICGRALSKNNCAHKCALLCHPGSCPLCIAMVVKYCGCGKTSQTLQCSTQTLLHCNSECGKDLNCGRHKCERTCHHGECGNCENIVEQECYCGKNKQGATCSHDVTFTYSCGMLCEKLLNCGNHACKKTCHSDDCEPCSLTPDKVTTCCCGQTALKEKRESCLDPIPTCDKVCRKNLKCGQPNNPHTCKANCHEGECPSCDLTTDVKCRCGNMDREISCKDLTSKADDARCEKRCIKKRACGKHKCNQLCCIDIEHVCPLQCSKTLSCGRHKCERSCHKGRCQPCWRSSFDELYCECGAAVIYPPVPCGTRRPTCERPCSRQHSCGHEVLHNCHSEPTCPPCTVLTQRWCHGKHELRKAVPCYVEEISCGLPCSKPLSCGRHKCITICHSGPCEKPGQQCVQPCTAPRELCGHICAAPCHEDKCPDIPCKEMVKVTCQCGHRTTSRVCAENAREYQRIASSILASKMADMQLGHSINLEEVFGQGAKKQNQWKTLDCNEECKLVERNRRLALSLQIVNPDLIGKLIPRYSDFMKQWAKKDPLFCQMVHEKLTELVQLAKTSKQKSRSYSFDSMNKDKRNFLHESCEHFGCESQAYDQEPKRNVVATAVKDKCWLPSYSLMEIVQRENGQRKVPGPVLSTSKPGVSVKTVLSLPTRKIPKPTTLSNPPSSSKAPEPEIDYFDYQG